MADDCGGRRGGNVVLQQDPQIQQSSYQQALNEGIPDPQNPSKNTVHYWSDFNRVFYHPRSIVQINDYELGSSLMPFEDFNNGEELFSNIDREEDLLDRDLRPWAEECDQLQGIQIWASADDAWGGFGSRYAERLRDEFGKIGLWAWSAEEGKHKGPKAKQVLRLTNAAKTLKEMSTHASMYIPMAVPGRLPDYVKLARDSSWHTSAMLATGLETMTLPSRLKSHDVERGFWSDMEAALNVNGNQRIAQLQCSILEPQSVVATTVHIRGSGDRRAPKLGAQAAMGKEDGESTEIRLDMNLYGEAIIVSPPREKAHSSDHIFGALDCLRGAPAEKDADEDAMYEDDDIGQARKRARFTGKPIIERYHSPLPFPTLSSFPAIFPTLALHDSVAVHTSLATTSSISTQVKAMKQVIARTVNSDERETLSNDLGEIAEAYEEGWTNEDDSDDD